MSITRQEWADWCRSEITQAVVAKLGEKRDDLIERMLNADGESIEEVALHFIRYRNQLEGLGEFLDLEGLGEWLVEETEDDDRTLRP